jgi:stearoyl-CoA desaturase (delta-9 desaturase)
MAMYTNERVLTNKQSCAKAGHVVLSPVKVLWVGGMILIAIIGGWYTFSLTVLFVFIITTSVILCFGHSLGMHRRLIHKSYQCPALLEYLFVHLGVIVGLAGPVGMIKTHDMRDWAQRQQYCHDYFGHQQPMWKDFFWQIFCDIKLTYPPTFNIETCVTQNNAYRCMEKTWMLQQLPLALLLFWLGGMPWVVWGICVRVSISIIGHWLIGYFAHNHGQRNWHVNHAHIQGYNVPFAALLTMGESYHNNHHAFPGSANFALEKGQLDVGWLVLKKMETLGLVWDLVLPKHLPKRDELQRINL